MLGNATVPVIGRSLAEVIEGLSPPAQAAADPDQPGNQDAPSTAEMAAASGSGDALSVFSALLQGGPNDFLVSQIGTSITTVEQLRDALIQAGDTVDLKTDGGVTRFDVTITPLPRRGQH